MFAFLSFKKEQNRKNPLVSLFWSKKMFELVSYLFRLISRENFRKALELPTEEELKKKLTQKAEKYVRETSNWNCEVQIFLISLFYKNFRNSNWRNFRFARSVILRKCLCAEHVGSELVLSLMRLLLDLIRINGFVPRIVEVVLLTIQTPNSIVLFVCVLDHPLWISRFSSNSNLDSINSNGKKLYCILIKRWF